MKAEERVILVKRCIYKLLTCNVVVTNTTCDGPPENIKTLELLGVDFTNPRSIKSELDIESEIPISAILDPPNMMKSVRKHFSKYDFKDDLNRMISWKFITRLVALQNTAGVRLANKLTDRHVEYYDSKMKVYLATQVLSSSVAISLDNLREDLQVRVITYLFGHSSWVQYLKCISFNLS